MLCAAFFFFAFGPSASAEKTTPKATLETHQDLILKAQNLTLQRDRLQASQILIRGIQREKAGSSAHKELAKALQELSMVFYSEKAQSLFALGETVLDSKPREAVEHFQEALRLEDGNVTVLSEMARAQLSLSDCEKADVSVKAAEAIDPYSPEVKLLALQILTCAKNYDGLIEKLALDEADDGSSFVKSLRTGLLVQSLVLAKTRDLKKAKSALAAWELLTPDYPEVQFWKFELSKLAAAPDRMAAAKYSQDCQNLTARKRKNYSLDPNLCKGKEAVDVYLKDNGLSSTTKSTP